MSAVWAPLMPLAMVGTDRQASLPAWPGDMGQLMAQAANQSPDVSTGALRIAGVLAVCSLAGAQGAAWSEPLPLAAGEDALPAVEGDILPTLMAWAFRDGPARLHHQICLALSDARYRLPTNLLPMALDLGRRSLALRAVLSPVLGERGRWLAAQRDDWRYAAGVDAEAAGDLSWTDGSVEQRRAFLARERALAPHAARERLQQALSELSAKERADMLGVLAEHLTLDDEPLLDALRVDRSREVRVVALALLLRLPEAAHPKRAMARMAAMLKHERALNRKRWVIDAPEAIGADWKVDNLDTPRPQHESLGDRAWLLYQVVRQVPLSWWTQHLDMSVQELLQWAKASDWHEALIRAWRDVLLAAPDERWCEAFLANWPETKLRDDPATILALLPRASREQYWQKHLGDVAAAPLNVLVPQMLAACPMGETLSPSLSTALVEILGKRAESNTLGHDHGLRWHLPDLCCALHMDAAARMAQWPRHAEETPSFAAILHTVTQVVATRRALHNLSTLKTT